MKLIDIKLVIPLIAVVFLSGCYTRAELRKMEHDVYQQKTERQTYAIINVRSSLKDVYENSEMKFQIEAPTELLEEIHKFISLIGGTTSDNPTFLIRIEKIGVFDRDEATTILLNNGFSPDEALDIAPSNNFSYLIVSAKIMHVGGTVPLLLGIGAARYNQIPGTLSWNTISYKVQNSYSDAYRYATKEALYNIH